MDMSTWKNGKQQSSRTKAELIHLEDPLIGEDEGDRGKEVEKDPKVRSVPVPGLFSARQEWPRRVMNGGGAGATRGPSW